MTIELSQGNVFFPEVPPGLQKTSPDLYEFLQSLKKQLGGMSQASLSNERKLADAINLGTSGTFTVSSGSQILVTSGIVTGVS